MIGSPISESELARREGLHKDYFPALKIQSTEKYYFIFSFDNCKEVSLRMYKEYVLDLIHRMTDIYYFFDDSNSTLKNILTDTKTYTAVHTFEKSIFKIIDKELSTQFSTIQNWIKIENEFNKHYKETHICKLKKIAS